MSQLWAANDASAQPRPIGEAIQFSAGELSQHSDASTAVAADGSFVVVWSLGNSLYGHRANRNGQPLGSQFIVFSPPQGARPFSSTMAMDDAGSFVTSWQRGYGAQLSAQRFDRNGVPAAPSFVVTDSTYSPHATAVSGSGELVVVWSEYGGDVYARRYDSAGSPRGGQIAVSTTEGGFSPDVVMRDDGSFVIAWSTYAPTDVAVRRYDRDANPIGASFVVNSSTAGYQLFADLGLADDGSFVVVWETRPPTGPPVSVLAQRFDRSGGHVGGEIEVAFNQPPGTQPTVVVQPVGDFSVFWNGNGGGAGQGDIVGQHFVGGRKRGTQFLVNTYTPGLQYSKSAARGDDGTIVVAWSGEGPSREGDGSDAGGIFAQRFRFGTAAGGPGDTDEDSVPDGADNCPTVANAEQTDVDDDGYGDDCVAPDVVISPSARIGANPVIGSGTTIAPGVVIGDDAVIGENVRIDRQVRAGHRLRVEDDVVLGRRSTLGDDVTIGLATRLDGPASIGNGVVIGDHAVLRRNASAADRATIGPLVLMGIGSRVGRNATVEMGASLGRGAIVSPNAVVPAGIVVPPGGTFP